MANNTGEKINIYSLRSYKFKKCLWRGKENAKIISIFFDNDNNYIGLYSTQKTLHIYPITELNIRRRTNNNRRPSKVIGINNNINENDEDEEQLIAIKGKKKNKIGGLFKNVKKKLGNKTVESFARYKDDKILVRDILLIFFNENKDVVMIDKIGKVFVIKFNKKNGGICWLIENKNLNCNT